jgi:hypothetical protein
VSAVVTTSTPRWSALLALCSTLAVGGAAAGLVAASGLEAGAAAAPVTDSGLSPEDAAFAAQADPDDRARFLLQKQMQQRAESAALVSQVAELRHQTAMEVINSIR